MKKSVQNLKGFRDFLPAKAAERKKVFETVTRVFERYGFLPLETPALEYKALLAGKYGDEGDKLMYSFTDQGKRDVAMRYDLTVPLARVIGQYQNDLSMPLKRYQIAPVWRADRPQKGRYREFTQCDIDVVGTESRFADAEVIACLDNVLKELGIRDVVIIINSRKFLNGLLKEAGIDSKNMIVVLRALDKLEKIGEKGVQGELATVGVQTKATDRLFELINQDFQDVKDFLVKFEGIEGAGELAELAEILLAMNVRNYKIDFTLARGLDYYTGTIFEMSLPDAREYGSVAGGGRYDDLLGQPAVGGSIGIDRLLAALEELELIKFDEVFDVLVCNLDENLINKYLETAGLLREAGIKTDFYYETAKLDKQLKYANKKNINFAVIIGQDEAKADQVSVKNLGSGKQEQIKQNELIKYLTKKS